MAPTPWHWSLSLLALISVGCGKGKPPAGPGTATNQAIAGRWEFCGTNRLGIAFRDDVILIDAWDAKDGSELTVSDESWDGRTLRYTTVWFETGITLHHEYQLTSSGTLEGRFTGDNNWNHVTWTRMDASRPNLEPSAEPCGMNPEGE